MLSLFSKVDTMVNKTQFCIEYFLCYVSSQTSELQQIKGNITLNRQQLNLLALSTVATYRVKRDGREGETEVYITKQ